MLHYSVRFGMEEAFLLRESQKHKVQDSQVMLTYRWMKNYYSTSRIQLEEGEVVQTPFTVEQFVSDYQSTFQQADTELLPATKAALTQRLTYLWDRGLLAKRKVVGLWMIKSSAYGSELLLLREVHKQEEKTQVASTPLRELSLDEVKEMFGKKPGTP